MEWQNALANYAITNGNNLSIDEPLTPSVFKDVKRALSAFRAKWLGGKTQAFELALDAQHCLEHLLSLDAMPKANPHSYHPTPEEVKHFTFEETIASPCFWGHLQICEESRPVEILEPSAGEGSYCDSICEAFTAAGVPFNLTVIELDEMNCVALRAKGYDPIKADFLKYKSDKKFDLVVMNPPFEGTGFIKHVRHAQSMLEEVNGGLVAVIPSKPLITNKTPLVTSFKNDVALTLDDPFIFNAGTFATAKTTETRLVELRSTQRMAKIITPAYKAYIKSNFNITVENEYKAVVAINKARSVEDVISACESTWNYCQSVNAHIPEEWFLEFCGDIYDEVIESEAQANEIEEFEVNQCDDLAQIEDTAPATDLTVGLNEINDLMGEISNTINHIEVSLTDDTAQETSEEVVQIPAEIEQSFSDTVHNECIIDNEVLEPVQMGGFDETLLIMNQPIDLSEIQF